MSRPNARMVMAALRGGAGKTTITVALAVAMHRRGIPVVPFKKGPDYIDAAWLSQAVGGPCYNLDTFLIGRDQVRASFSRRTRETSVALIEGNRGLFDGMNVAGEHSTAELAKLLEAPVLLVVDCDKVTRTTAAMVLGCLRLDPDLDIRGVILNRVGGERHAALARRCVEEICGVPVLGCVPRVLDLPLPERHLGLVPPPEHGRVKEVLDKAGEIAEKYLDVEAIVRTAMSALEWKDAPPPQTAGPGDNSEPVIIGVIRDAAFQFYYRENIEALEDCGARIVTVSAIEDKTLAPLDALYIGGGFPETQARLLSRNETFNLSLKLAAEAGLPIYAESGGFVYLGETLIVGETQYPMAGVLPLTFKMERRPQGHGYTVMDVAAENPFFPVGTRLHGHEFHYCRIISGAERGRDYAFQVVRGVGMGNGFDGYLQKKILGGFNHLHADGAPQWAPGLIAAARAYRDSKGIRGGQMLGDCK